MARSGGYNFRPVILHPFFLATTLFTVVGWFTAFIGQVITESNFQKTTRTSGSVVGVAWYGIFHQLFTSILILLALGSDTVPEYRFQISLFLGVSVVFAVFGTNEGIFASGGSVLAIGAGWLLLAFADILHLLYFTSPPLSPIFTILNAPAPAAFPSTSFTPKTSPYGVASGVSSATRRSTAQPRSSTINMNNGDWNSSSKEFGNGWNSTVSVDGGGGGALIGSIGTAKSGGDVTVSTPLTTGRLETESLKSPAIAVKAKALYPYTASADDPNEISFAKGEILDIVDNSGKWWQARKSDGTQGIVPSNYVQMLG